MKTPAGRLRQRQQLARHLGEMVGHVDAARDEGGVGGEVGVRQQRPGVRIGAFGGGEQARDSAQAPAPPARERARNWRREMGWQMNRHGLYLRAPGRRSS